MNLNLNEHKLEIVLQQLDIVIAARNLKPGILTTDFLEYAAVIPGVWELARPAINSNSFSQVDFQNGFSMKVEQNRVLLLESVEGKQKDEIAAPYIAQNFIQSLPNVEYEAIGINPRGYVPFNQQQDAARKYLNETLLKGGSWQEIGNTPMQASVNLVYNLERSPFYLTISQGALRFQDESSLPVVMFGGGFSYGVEGNTIPERINNMQQIINNWQLDLQTFQDIISSKFLPEVGGSIPATPDLFAMAAV